MHRELIRLNQPMTGVTISDLQAPTAGSGQRILTPAEIEETRRNQLLERSDQTMQAIQGIQDCLLYTSPSPRDQRGSRMPSSA